METGLGNTFAYVKIKSRLFVLQIAVTFSLFLPAINFACKHFCTHVTCSFCVSYFGHQFFFFLKDDLYNKPQEKKGREISNK